MMPDYYRILNVRTDASHEEIHEAWRSLARAHHPDRHGEGASEVSMTLLNAAWTTLGNPARREAYDRRRRVRQVAGVDEAILAAAGLAVAGRGWAHVGVLGGDVLLRRGNLHLSIRYAKVADSSVLGAWLASGTRSSGEGRIDCAVLVSCSVLDREEVTRRVNAADFPAVVIDLLESRSFGVFPSRACEELFRPLIEVPARV